jgi:hypothetical protein
VSLSSLQTKLQHSAGEADSWNTVEGPSRPVAVGCLNARVLSYGFYVGLSTTD